nr:diaminobutyrate--2-oxoglutarate transaminase [Planctomycetota bacterium]
TNARGSELIDSDGQHYLDFLGGAGTLNYGHNHPRLKRAVIDYLQKDGVLHGLDMHTEAKERFMTTFRDLILEPRGLDYKMQFTGPTGTNAVEAAMKLARKITGRHDIISFTNAFHGMTLGAVAATGNSHHRGGAGVPLSGTTFMPYSGYFGSETDTIAYMERLIEDPSSGVDLPAAMILETVQGEGGVNVASRAWLQRLAELCRRNKILLIVDDIQVGCGRTGSFFSFEGYDIEPDIVTLSKSLGGIGLPMALVLMKPELDQWKPGEHNGTFRGNNLAFVAATEALESFWGDKRFEEEIREKGAILRQRLQWIKADNPELKAQVRGRGMIYGIDFEDATFAGDLVQKCYERKLIIENCGPKGRVLKFLGPLTTTVEQLNDGLDRLVEAVAELVAERASAKSLAESR